MDLPHLRQEYAKLAEVVEENFGKKQGNLWQVCFQWWKVFQLINEELAQHKSLKERDEIIAEFAQFQKKLEKQVLKQPEEGSKTKAMGDIPLLDDVLHHHCPHTQQIVHLMRHQRKLFIENVKALKREKEGKTAVRKKRLKSKWLKS